jgi:hypothetical protein
LSELGSAATETAACFVISQILKTAYGSPGGPATQRVAPCPTPGQVSSRAVPPPKRTIARHGSAAATDESPRTFTNSRRPRRVPTPHRPLTPVGPPGRTQSPHYKGSSEPEWHAPDTGQGAWWAQDWWGMGLTRSHSTAPRHGGIDKPTKQWNTPTLIGRGWVMIDTLLRDSNSWQELPRCVQRG